MNRPVGCAVVAFALTAALLVTHVARRHDGDVTGIYHVTAAFLETTALAKHYAADDLRLTDGPYDSLFTLAFATDPLALDAREPGHDAQRFYRARRIALSWAGWALGAGRPPWIPFTIPLAHALFVAITVFVLARVLDRHGRDPRWSLLHAAALGTIVCTLRPLGDAVAVNATVLGLAAWSVRRPGAAAAAFAVAMLARETAAIAPLVVLASTGLRGTAWRPIAAAFLAPAVWFAWVWATDRAPDWGTANLGVPLAGIVERARSAAPHVGVREQFAFACTLAGLVVCVAAGPRAWSIPRFVGAAFVALAALTTHLVWVEFWAYGRVHAFVPALLLFAYARDGRRADLLAPIASAAAGLAIATVA